ncbi:MAG: galactokinase [Clostridia bacterium]|nr:galactokinase [Clostridia bacterium]
MEIKELIKEFENRFGKGGEIRIFQSPGRVNLIGEHTDYNGGYVFPAALTMRTAIAYRKRNDNIIKMMATDLDDVVEADINNLDAYKDLWWGNYQIGIADVMKKKGYEICGCDMLFDDTTPHGGGLSSSAAIEVATALAFATISNEIKGISDPVDMIEMAKISQQAEHEYIGVMCGIMDQFASAMGKKNHAIMLNCKTLEYDLVPVNIDGYKLVISNTNKKRSLADSKYNERRSECEEAVEGLKKSLPGITCLADITPEQFEKFRSDIKNPISAKRAEHVVYEIDRVVKSREALNKNDIAEFGRLMNASHDSLRDLYEVTGVELDTLVDEARKVSGVLGSRMTGAGFGGCTVSIVKDDSVDEFISKVGENYTNKIGYAPSFYISEIGDGGHETKV